MYLQESTLFDLDLKFKVATSNGLGGDTFTRNVTDVRTDGQTDGRTDDGPTLTRN